MALETDQTDRELLERLEARLKANPDLYVLTRNLIREFGLNEEKDLSKKWANIIRKDGAAFVHGKINDGRFKDVDQSTLIKPDAELGFQDLGHINCSAKSSNFAHPIFRNMAVSIGRYSNQDMAKVRITDTTQVLLLSPTFPIDHPFNTRMLDSRMQKPFREIYWKARVDTDLMANPGTRSLQSSLGTYFYLPDSEATKLFADAQEYPDISLNLCRNLWPNMPSTLANAPERLFAKEFTVEDLGKEYLDDTVSNGQFISFNQDIA